MGSSWYLMKSDPAGDEPKLDFDLNRLYAKFTSRKFLLALSGALTMLASGRKTEAAGIIVAYILGEAHIDAKAAS